jgi:hypothetical protein
VSFRSVPGDVDPRVMRVARAVARERMRDGALAVVLSGSHARGAAGPESDVDLIAVVVRPPKAGHLPAPAERRGGYLVHVAWATRASVRATFADPGAAGTFVPGWREAIVLEDPAGAAAKLRREAEAWTWARIDAQCDAWVANAITGWSEEVHKLADALASGDTLNAAAQRSLLALHLAHVMAVHRRKLFGTDNVMWDLVAGAMGDQWRAAQRVAFAVDGEPLDTSCRAALRLYALAAREVAHLLDRRQRAVVAHACGLAGAPLPPTATGRSARRPRLK